MICKPTSKSTFRERNVTSFAITSSRATISAASTSASEALSLAILRVSARSVDHKLNVDLTSCLKIKI